MICSTCAQYYVLISDCGDPRSIVRARTCCQRYAPRETVLAVAWVLESRVALSSAVYIWYVF